MALVYSPNQDWNLYGALTHGLEHGGIAPIQTTNENTALAPSRSKQVELGIKGALGNDMTVSAALFQIRKGLEFTNAANTYVRSGDETHRGLELSAQGRASADLHYGLSLLALHTEQQGTGQAAIDGKRVTDVPNFKSSAWVEYCGAGSGRPEAQRGLAVCGQEGVRRREPRDGAGLSPVRPGRGLRHPRRAARRPRCALA